MVVVHVDMGNRFCHYECYTWREVRKWLRYIKRKKFTGKIIIKRNQ